MNKKQKHNGILLFILLSMTMLTPIGIDIYAPSFPAMSAELMISKSLIQISITVYLLSVGISQIIMGPLADYFGRKAIAIPGMIIFASGSIIAPYHHSIFYLLLGRAIQGFGIASTSVAVKAIAADFYKEKISKIMPLLSLFYSLAPIVAPLIGGYLQNYFGWEASFIFLFIITCVLLPIYWKFLPETLIKEKKIPLSLIPHKYLKLLKNKKYMGYIICAFLTWSAVISFNIIAPFVAQNTYKLTSIHYGWTAMLIGLGYLIGCILSSISILFHRALTSTNLIKFGLFLYVITACAFFILTILKIQHYYIMVIITIILAIGAGFSFPNYMSESLLASTDHLGFGGALLGTLICLGEVLVTSIIAALKLTSYIDLSLIFLVLSILTLFVYLIFINEKRND